MVQRRQQQGHISRAGGNANGGDEEQKRFSRRFERGESGEDGGCAGGAEGVFGQGAVYAEAGDDEIGVGDDGLHWGSVEHVSLGYREVGRDG